MKIKNERQLALKKAFDAVRDPATWLSICQDGTNQLPFGYPSYVEIDKELNQHRIKTHLMISLVHGRGCYVYVTPEVRVPSDPNLTIECLQRTIQKVEAADGFLPPNLCLQFDNCWRENKNAYVLAYLTWLVNWWSRCSVIVYIYTYIQVGRAWCIHAHPTFLFASRAHP